MYFVLYHSIYNYYWVFYAYVLSHQMNYRLFRGRGCYLLFFLSPLDQYIVRLWWYDDYDDNDGDEANKDNSNKTPVVKRI